MDGTGIGDFGGGNEVGDVEVRKAAGGRTNADGFVSKANVEAIFVGSGVNGDSGDTHFTAGPDDAEGNFSSVGDEYLIEQGPFSYELPVT